MTRAVDVGQFGNQLSVVLIGGEHVALYSDGIGLFGQRADDVVGLETVYLKDGDAVGTQYVLDDGYGLVYVLWRRVTLCFVVGESLAAECRPVRVESHADMRRFLLL